MGGGLGDGSYGEIVDCDEYLICRNGTVGNDPRDRIFVVKVRPR